MGEEYQGEERRHDKTNVRLALLERAYFENKESQVAIHKRITEIRKEVAVEIRTGFDSLFQKLDKQQEKCNDHNSRTTALEGTVKWLDRWLISTWALLASAFGYVIHMKTKQ